MIDFIVTGLLWIAAVGCGVMAGVFFAFSTFIMTALERIGPGPGALAMNSISVTILSSLFMPVFYATTLASLVLAGLSLTHWRAAGSATLAVAGLIYVLGMFGSTLFFNVPLNDALAAAIPGSADAAAVWARYLKDWSLWNHVRTIASILATALFIIALRTRA